MEIPFTLSFGLHRLTPSQNTYLELGCALVVGGMAIKLVKQCYPKGWMQEGKSLLNRVPAMFQRQKAEFDHCYSIFCREWSERYAKFECENVSIPEDGWNDEQLQALIYRWANLTNEAVVYNHLSEVVVSIDRRIMQLQTNLLSVALKADDQWNSLSLDEFSFGSFINYQLIRMVADLFGGDINDVKGMVTGDSTESLMMAAKAYRNWGKRTKGLDVGECVIVAPKSIHAALLKAGDDYEMTIALADIDADGYVNLGHMEELMEKYNGRLVAVFASTPSYVAGGADEILKIASLARKYDCGMHVDACLGGFVVNFLNEGSKYLALPEVTSLSCDIQKRDFRINGSSVLVTKQLGGYNLAFDAIYTYPYQEGSCAMSTPIGGLPSVSAFTALLSMLCTGKTAYRKMAQQINSVLMVLLQEIKERFSGKICIVGPQQANALVIKMDERGFRKGAIYTLVQKMNVKGFYFNHLKGQQAYFCVTYQFAEKQHVVHEFLTAMEASLKEVEKINGSHQAFPNEAAIYGMQHGVLDPQLKSSDGRFFLENALAELSVKKLVEANF